MEGYLWSGLVAIFCMCLLGPPMCANAVTVTTIAQRSTTEGADAHLTCTYNPHTTPDEFGYLAWSKDGTTFLTYACDQSCELQGSAATSPGKYALNVDTTSSGNLTIFGVGLEDEAIYMCSVLTSDLVVYSSTTQLSVDVPIQGLIVSDFRTTSYTDNSIVQIQVDQSYQFRCSLALPTKPSVTIAWEGERIDVTMDDQVDEPSSDDSGLVTSHRIAHVTPGMQDSGKVLRCLATHPTTGQTVVSSVVLDVQVCPSAVLIHKCPTAVNSGDSATLACRSAATSPPPVLYWLYEGSRVENTSSEFRATIAEDGANILTYTKEFDRDDVNKDFMCCIESTSMCSQLCSEPCRPSILYPPSEVTVHSSRSLDSVEEGSALNINCTARGNPIESPHISWTRIDEAGNVAGPQRDSPLRFDAVGRSDAGMYRCTVDNGLGSSSTLTKIIVYHAPNVTNDQGYRAHGNEGDAAWLSCDAEANPKPTITWYTPDNRTITEASSAITSEIKQTDYSIHVTSKLHVINIDPAINYGRYRCQAENDYGRAELFVNLSGKSKPFPPNAVHFNQKATTDNSLTVTWQPGHDGGADQTFTVTSCLVGATNEKCTVHRGITETWFQITALRSYSWYDVSVTGVNVFGESEALRPARNSTSPLSPDQLNVVATYDIGTGFIQVKPRSNNTQPLPDDLCFDLEVKVIVSRREEVCLKLNDRFHVETEVSQSQIWVVSCGRGVCSGADHVMFPPLPEEISSPESKDLDITSLVAIVAGAIVCLVIILIVFAAWKWNKKRGSMVHKQMSSRKLPTLPRGNSCGPPSPSCQEAMESQVYDGLELGSMNPYMHPYAQSTLPSNKQCKPPTSNPTDSDLQFGNEKDNIPPPSGDKVKQNHIDGTYTTTLQSYLPMKSPVVLKKSERKPSSSSNNNMNRSPETADVTTALLVEVEDARRSPNDSDDGYYSVPKSTRVDPIDETTPALEAH